MLRARQVVKFTLPTTLFYAALAAALGVTPARADVSGVVLDDDDAPIAGAIVHLQATLNGPSTTTNALGQFTLPIPAPGPVNVAAFVAYNRDNPINYNTNSVDTEDPQTNLEIRLNRIPTRTNNRYEVPAVNQSCVFCHSEIAEEWQTSVHAGAGTDFWVRDLFSGDGSPGGSAGFVFTATHDPGETGTCATCHQVMSDVRDPGNTMFNTNTGPGVTDGVSCLGCHQIHALGNPDAIHTLGSAEYRFPAGGDVSTDRYVWGPLDDVDTAFMRASYAPHFKDSQLCASCHQYQRPFGQTTYDEWLASPFAVAGPNFRACQDCHMPARQEEGQVCDLFGAPVRPVGQRHQHDFVGSTPSTLAANIGLFTEVSQDNGRLTVRTTVDNFGAGHDFPTGISIRNALLIIKATVNGQELTQIAGPVVPAWGDDDVPGQQPGDYAGRPGTGYGKILEGQINDQGPTVWPVLFIDADNVRELKKVHSGGTDTTEVEFALGGAEQGDALHVEARLIYRRAFRALAVTKGWTETPQGGPIEIDVQANNLDLEVTGAVLDVPAAGSPALLLLAFAIAAAALVLLRRG